MSNKNFPAASKNDTEFYADYDEDSGLFCVFGNDSGHAYSSYCSLEDAETAAKVRNAKL